MADLMDLKRQTQQLRHIRFSSNAQFFPDRVAIGAKIADMTDSAIVEAIIELAQQEGITDLYLIDQQFAMDALTEKLERKNQDFVPVVRCKDCKRYFETRTKGKKQMMRWCMRLDGAEFHVQPNDFCSYGARSKRPCV